MRCRNLLCLLWVSQSQASKNTNMFRKPMCSCQVYKGSEAELVKKTPELHIYLQRNRLSSSSLRAPHLPQGLSFSTVYSFPCIASGGPSTFKSSENKSYPSLCNEAALRSGRFNGAYVQLCSSAQHPQHVIMHTMMVSSRLLLLGQFQCSVLKSFHSISEAEEITYCRKWKGRL